MSDPYVVLGLPRHATADEIKRAYHAAVLQHHPDKSSSTTPTSDSFVALTEAYNALKTPEGRRKVDESLAPATRRAHFTVDLDECTYDEGSDVYSYDCRCGGAYTVSGEELSTGFDTVQCTDCSLIGKFIDATVTTTADTTTVPAPVPPSVS